MVHAGQGWRVCLATRCCVCNGTVHLGAFPTEPNATPAMGQLLPGHRHFGPLSPSPSLPPHTYTNPFLHASPGPPPPTQPQPPYSFLQAMEARVRQAAGQPPAPSGLPAAVLAQAQAAAWQRAAVPEGTPPGELQAAERAVAGASATASWDALAAWLDARPGGRRFHRCLLWFHGWQQASGDARDTWEAAAALAPALPSPPEPRPCFLFVSMPCLRRIN